MFEDTRLMTPHQGNSEHSSGGRGTGGGEAACEGMCSDWFWCPYRRPECLEQDEELLSQEVNP